MNKLLVKIFIKNYKDKTNSKVREAYGKLASIVGIISNVLLSVIKIIIGCTSNSVAIIADGINNVADASSSLITLIGFKLSNMPEDEDHPYGHARIEYLTGLIVSILIIIVGLSLLKESILKVINPEMQNYNKITIIVLAIAIVIKLWQATFNFFIGKEINSSAIKATGTDSRNDVIATSVVLLSVIISYFFNIYLDGYLGILVSLFIIKSGIDLVKETSSPLLGEAPSKELVEEITVKTLSYKGVLGIHDLVVHNYGPGKIFASLHVEIDAEEDIMTCHDMIDNIEREIGDELNIHFVVHMDPVYTNDPVVEEIKVLLSDILKDIHGIREYHDVRAVVGPTHTNVVFDIVLLPNCNIQKKEITNLVQEGLNKINPTYYAVITYDNAYF